MPLLTTNYALEKAVGDDLAFDYLTVDLAATLDTIDAQLAVASAATLTGKTLTSPIINTPVVSGGSWSSPALTGGTITSPTLAGTIAGTPTWSSPQAMSITGNAASATTADAVAANALTGTTLASNVVASSLTSLGTLTALGLVSAAVIDFGSSNYSITHSVGLLTFSGPLAIGGALSGVTTLATSSTINSQTISATANFTGTVTVATSVLPDADGGAVLGASGTGWSNLFLAEGAVINWDAGDLTLTQTGNVLALAGGTLDMSNNLISNIGAAGTDFTATGGLTLADTLTVTAGNLVMTVGDIIVITAASIRLDGNASGNTYIREESADVVAITAGGTVAARFNVGSVTITSGLTVTAGGATITAGNLGIGAAGADAGIGAYIATTTLTGTTQTGVHSRVTFSSAATVAGNAILAQVRTAAAAYTMTNAYGAFVDNANIGAASAITNLYGIYITAQSGASTLNIGLYNAGTTTLVGNTDLGVAGATLGVLKFNGNTSGTITVQSAAAAGTWTFTLPPDDGDAGEQLQTNGSGVTTWEAAASERKYKLLGAMPTPQWGLEAILRMPIHSFHYDPKSGKAKDFATEYYGVVADEAPLVMHWGGTIFNEISAFGLTTLAIQRHEQRIAQLEAENRELRQLVGAI